MNYLMLVNKNNKIKETPVLIKAFSEYKNNIFLEQNTYQAFLKLKKEFPNLVIISAYRDNDYQERLFNNLKEEKGIEYANKYIAKPGYSEHQTGLALDFGIRDNNKFIIEHDLEKYPQLKNIHQRLAHYGFILRYPKNKEHITGYNYEPWHIRYVGDKAEQIMDNNLCLEEYLEIN